MAFRFGKKRIKQAVIAVIFLGVTVTLMPIVMAVWILAGILDVMRHEKRDWYLIQRYFSGNGFTTWSVAPINLFFDLLCYRNRKIYKLDDFSDEARAELDEVLGFFKENRQAVIDRIDAEMGDAKRGMFLCRWFGHLYSREFEPLNKPFRHVRTIAVSVFDGKERTNFHFGPQRLSLRVLYNLTPVDDAEVFIECGKTQHYWNQDPLFIFDDTLMHRSVNDHDGRRFVVFLDVLRPSPVPGLLGVLILPISWLATVFKPIFYRRWKMMGV